MKTPVIIGSMVRGAAHKRKGTECQDSYKIAWLDEGSVVVAVADGHGSQTSPYSKTGSAIAVNVFCREIETLYAGYRNDLERLMTYLNRDGDTRIAQQIRKEWCDRVIVNHRRRKRSVPALPSGEVDSKQVYRQYGTTLLGLLVTPLFLFAFQIGDGDITYVSEGEVNPLVAADKILGTETHSLSKGDAWEKANAAVYRNDPMGRNDAMILLSTDGFSNSYRDEEAFKTACREYRSSVRLHGAEAVSRHLKAWLDETSEKGCGDDITLMMICLENGTDDGFSVTREPQMASESNQEQGKE